MRMIKALIIICVGIMFFTTYRSHAQSLPGSADPGRILNDLKQAPEPRDIKPALERPVEKPIVAPAGSENLLFTLKSVSIEGMSVFDKADFKKQFENKIGEEVPASFLWELSQAITNAYKQEGYFLSRAYVPPQKIDTGDVRISIIEGFIEEVEIDGDSKDDKIVRSITNKILQQKPTNIKNLESQLLSLNDLYGISFNAILSKKKGGKDGSVVLNLKQKKRPSGQVTLSTNNYGSRFVGPYRSGVTYEESISDYQQTTISGLSSVPQAEELSLVSVNHRIQITPSLELDFLLSKTKSQPGFTLKQSEVESDSFSWGFGAQWILLRQRDENLTLSARVESLDLDTDTFSTPLTRDRIRTFRANLNYDFIDRFMGLNTLNVTISQGIPALGASDEGDPDLSREDASPNFQKLEASYNRQAYVAKDTVLNVNVTSQIASESLFSSEEFGYGGINIGRAYDFSEITGDHGISGSAELQYTGFQALKGYKFDPFVFYDIGKIWNEGNTDIPNVSASSTGFGMRAFGQEGLNFDATVAFPLTRSIDNPIQGGNGSNAVFRFGLTYKFDARVPRFFNSRNEYIILRDPERVRRAEEIFIKSLRKK